MTFARPTLSDLYARAQDDLNGRLPGADSRLRRSVLDVLARIHSGALSGAYGYLDQIALDVIADTAESSALERHASIWGVARKAAIAAIGPAAAAGTNGAVIPAASVLQRADGAQFTTGDDLVIAGGAGALTLTAVDAGVAGNTAAGTVLTFTSPAAGVLATVTVSAPGLTGAADEESDTLLRQRLLARIQTPPQGGAESDYLAWALAQPEVTRAWVYPGWVGAGSVGVAVVMDGRPNIFPTADDIAAIQAAMDLLRPVTATLVVFAPVATAVPFTVQLVPSTAATKAAAQASIADLFAREAEPGGTLLISHIREAIDEAAGVNDYVLTAPAANVVAAAGHILVPGAWTFL